MCFFDFAVGKLIVIDSEECGKGKKKNKEMTEKNMRNMWILSSFPFILYVFPLFLPL
jgi:hypothetical protein